VNEKFGEILGEMGEWDIGSVGCSGKIDDRR